MSDLAGAVRALVDTRQVETYVWERATERPLTTRLAAKVDSRGQVRLYQSALMDIIVRDEKRLGDTPLQRLQHPCTGVIPLRVRRSPPASADMPICVIALTGRHYTVNASRAWTVLDLKEHVQAREGIPVDQQRLIFAGKQLDEEQNLCLADYKIQKDSSRCTSCCACAAA